ncbi:ABC transporter ATP-binding protein [Paenibacillaceae bacterium]|nr:ABC transporter ATP-binding protein [Paenibacillaceae bacterium]
MIRLFRFLKLFWIPVAGVLLFTFFQTLSELYLPTLMADIVDKGIVQGDIPYIWRIGGVMLLIAAGGTAFSIFASYLSSKAAAGFGRTVREKVFGHVANFSLQEFDKIGTSSLINRTTNDITQVQQVLNMMLRMMVMAPMMCIGGIFMAVTKEPGLSWIIMIIIPVLALSIYGIARKGIPYFKVLQTKLDKLNLVLREGLTGIRVIRSFNRTAYESGRFGEANEDLTDTAIRVNKIMALMMPAMMLIMNMATIAILWFGGLKIEEGTIMIGSLMAFIQYVMQIMFSLIMVSMMFVMIPRAQASAVRINEVLDMEATIHNPEHAAPAAGQAGNVEFQNVSFSYPGAEKPALSNISFHAAPGEITAIIGGTGSGKSTLVSLIPRFYDINQDGGRLLINGVDVRDISQEELRSKIGFVPQRAVLFSGTIADNIKYGKEDATEEEIRKAAETAQAAEFISRMEGGYEAAISQGGSNVSGGQKQRLSIARALVRRPEIYVFDDSFSALDFKTDAKLRAALKQETTESTVLIVAQRVSTVMDADRIIVLDDGEIVGMGTHRELMAANQIYQEIVSSQLSEEESA